MSNVWKRLQRVGKKAAKFNIKTYSHVLNIECTHKWQPNKITIIFSHKNRKKISKSSKWEPSQSFNKIYDGICVWNKNDIIDFDVTLYKGNNDEKYESKEWTISVEDEDAKGKKRLIATAVLPIHLYAYSFNETEVNLNLKFSANKILNANLKFFLTSSLLKEGKATDDDMISLQSYASNASTLPRNTQDLFNTQDNDFLNDIDHFNYDEVDKSEAKLKNTLLQEITNITSSSNDKTGMSTINEISSININNSKNQVINELNKSSSLTSSAIKVKKKENKSTNPFETSINNNNNNNNPFLNDINEDDDKNNPFFNDNNNENENEKSNNNNINNNKNSFVEVFEKELVSNNKKDLSYGDSDGIKELLDWCKNITKSYNNVNIENFSTSWKDGLAFCAIIHHFRPELLDLNSMKKNEAFKNLKAAFDISDKENIPRALQTVDLLQREIPDKLSIITYVYQLKDHFEKNKQINNITTISINNKSSIEKTPFKKDEQNNKTSTPIFTVPNKNKPLAPIVPVNLTQLSSNLKQETITPIKKEKPILNKYMNPFDCDDDDDDDIKNDSSKIKNDVPVIHSGIIEIKHDGKVLDAISDNFDSLTSSNNSSLEESFKKNISKKSSNETNLLKQRARQLKQQQISTTSQKSHLNTYDGFSSVTTSSNTSSATNKIDNLKLAKQMISEARKPSTTDFDSLDSLSSPNDSYLIQLHKPTMNIDVNLLKAHESNTELANTDRNTIQKIDNQNFGDDYINEEMINITKEQNELDEKAINLEKNLRKIMKNDENKKQEDLLIQEWFLLVNKKNALIHRQLELEILHKEKDLQKRYDLLKKELQNLMQIDDRKKSEEQKKNEKYLLNELVSLVDQRNEIVVQLDEENRNLESEQEIDNFIKNKSNFSSNNKNEQKACNIQ